MSDARSKLIGTRALARLRRRAATHASKCLGCRRSVAPAGPLPRLAVRCAQCLRVFCLRCAWYHFRFTPEWGFAWAKKQSPKRVERSAPGSTGSPKHLRVGCRRRN